MEKRAIGYFGESGNRNNPLAHEMGYVLFVQGQRYAEVESTRRLTTNAASYRALQMLILKAIETGVSSLIVRSSATLVINQMSGRWKAREPVMREQLAATRELAAQIPTIRYELVKTHDNEALRVARRARIRER